MKRVHLLRRSKTKKKTFHLLDSSISLLSGIYNMFPGAQVGFVDSTGELLRYKDELVAKG